MKNSVTKIKHIVEELSIGLQDAKEQISDLEDKVMKATKINRKKIKIRIC